jgi:membrane protease YdiL (CAAX protease family)
VRTIAIGDGPAPAVVPRPSHPAAALAGLVVGVLGAVALALRPVGWEGMVATAGIGLVALAVAPTQASARARMMHADGRSAWSSPAALAVGLLAVLMARSVGVPFPGPVSAVGVGASLVAAAAEEALFRGVLHGALERLGAGTAVAIGVPAALFALVHVPGYGPGSLPVNLAAGLLLGWQRHASRSWTIPAATHGAANLIRFL